MQIILNPIAEGPFISVRYEKRLLTVNDKPHEMSDGTVFIDYGEQMKCVTFSDDPGVSIKVIPSSWVDPTPPPKPDPEAEAQAALEAWRETAGAEALNLAIIMGKDRWQALEAWTANDFVLSILVKKATWIPRRSDTVELFRWFFDLTPEQADDWFRAAAAMGRL